MAETYKCAVCVVEMYQPARYEIGGMLDDVPDAYGTVWYPGERILLCSLKCLVEWTQERQARFDTYVADLRRDQSEDQRQVIENGRRLLVGRDG